MLIMDLNITITLLFLALLFLVGLVFTKSSTSSTHIDEVKITTNKKKKKMKSTSTGTGTGTGGDNCCNYEDNSRREAELKSVFATFDKNRDGFITKQELRESLENIGMSTTEGDAVEMVEKVDVNGDGLIDFEEFRQLFESMMVEKKRQPKSSSSSEEEEELEEEGDLKEAFGVFDGDKDGLISVEELGLVLDSLGFKEGKRLDACKEMIRKVDIDGDGMVSFFEFKCMMKSGTSLISV